MSFRGHCGLITELQSGVPALLSVPTRPNRKDAFKGAAETVCENATFRPPKFNFQRQERHKAILRVLCVCCRPPHYTLITRHPPLPRFHSTIAKPRQHFLLVVECMR